MTADPVATCGASSSVEGRGDRVSVVIPLFNHVPYIGRAIDSVISQTVPAEEIIVIDDGSSDGSADRMRQICAAHPEIIFWSWPNQGAHHALNAGILRATGDYIAILNSDDCFHPDRFAACLEAMRAHPEADLVATAVRFVDADGTPIGNGWYEEAIAFFRANRSLPLALFHGNFLVSTSNFFLRRRIFERVGYFAPLRYAHDLEFVLRLVGAGRGIHFVDVPLLDYRLHGQNTIGKDTWREDSERAAIFAFFLHEQWLRGSLSDPDLVRFVGELERQRLTEPVAHFLGQLGTDGFAAAGRLPRRLALAFLDCQQRLSIDWTQRDLGDPELKRLTEARAAAFGRNAAQEKGARDAEAQAQALRAALDEMAQAKAWFAEQRDAWQRVASDLQAQQQATAAALQEMTRAKEWFAEQRDAWERQARAASAQAESLASRLVALDKLLSEAQTERDRLRADLRELRRRPLIRLLLRLGGVRLPDLPPDPAGPQR